MSILTIYRIIDDSDIEWQQAAEDEQHTKRFQTCGTPLHVTEQHDIEQRKKEPGCDKRMVV